MNCISSIFLLCFILSTHGQIENGVMEETMERNQNLQSTNREENVWTVYDRNTFDENELCRVLNCRKRDYCLVQGETAICLSRKKLSEAPGHKVFYRKLEHMENEEILEKSDGLGVLGQKSSKQGYSIIGEGESPGTREILKGGNSAVEWDADRVRQKLASHYRSMKRKQRNRAAMSRANQYETPHTFKENNSGQRSGHGGGKKRCNPNQLSDIGARLIQWFSDMQAHYDAQPSSAVQKRGQSSGCRQEARWMFVQLDHDSNDQLDADELYALTYDHYEPCVKPFLEKCDRNANTRLSIPEWCHCFT